MGITTAVATAETKMKGKHIMTDIPAFAKIMSEKRTGMLRKIQMLFPSKERDTPDG